jgi:hypothetical protein
MVDLIGGTDLLGMLQNDIDVWRRLFHLSKSAIDHMLCAVTLFHISEHADWKRDKILLKAFKELDQKESRVSIKKQSGKVEAHPLLTLVKEAGGAHLVLSVDGRDPLKFFDLIKGNIDGTPD